MEASFTFMTSCWLA